MSSSHELWTDQLRRSYSDGYVEDGYPSHGYDSGGYSSGGYGSGGEACADGATVADMAAVRMAATAYDDGCCDSCGGYGCDGGCCSRGGMGCDLFGWCCPPGRYYFTADYIYARANFSPSISFLEQIDDQIEQGVGIDTFHSLDFAYESVVPRLAADTASAAATRKSASVHAAEQHGQRHRAGRLVPAVRSDRGAGRPDTDSCRRRRQVVRC